MANYITTFTGQKFYFDVPTPVMAEQIFIEDIAHSLSMLCRFTGHARRFYSVAEHSLLLSQQVPLDLALCGLLHDATEAYCNDLAKPLKRQLPDYNALEDRVWAAVAFRFELPVVMPELIKMADMAMLKYEVPRLMPHGTLEDLDLPGQPANLFGLPFYSSETAERIFIRRFQELVAMGYGVP